MSLAKALAGWQGRAALFLLGATLSIPAWFVQGKLKDGEIAAIQRDHALIDQARDRATLAGFDKLITENSRRYAAVESERERAQEAEAAARADVAGQRAAADRLRQRAERMVADAIARNPTLADGGPATGTAFDMLAHVLGRAIDAAGQLAEYADHARIAGLTCERLYDQLGKDGFSQINVTNTLHFVN